MGLLSFVSAINGLTHLMSDSIRGANSWSSVVQINHGGHTERHMNDALSLVYLILLGRSDVSAFFLATIVDHDVTFNCPGYVSVKTGEDSLSDQIKHVWCSRLMLKTCLCVPSRFKWWVLWMSGHRENRGNNSLAVTIFRVYHVVSVNTGMW